MPFERVDSFCSNISIWSASPALSACSSLRFASSAFFSFMRAISTGDAPEEGAPMDWCRRWDASGRESVWRLFSMTARLWAAGICATNLI